jgi:hypothetical protein
VDDAERDCVVPRRGRFRRLPFGAVPRLVPRHDAAPEPTSRLPIAWGDYSGRYLTGVVLLVGGAALVVQTTAATLSLGMLGSLLLLASWAVQPGRPLVRAAVAVPSLLLCWCTITGPKSMWVLALILPCWLLVRRRPPITYWTTLIPLGLGLLLASCTSLVADKDATFWVVVGGVVAAAWLSREYALKLRLVHTDRIGEGPAEQPSSP